MKKNKGFTIVELLVVICIISILGGMTLGSFDGLLAKTKGSLFPIEAQVICQPDCDDDDDDNGNGYGGRWGYGDDDED